MPVTRGKGRSDNQRKVHEPATLICYLVMTSPKPQRTQHRRRQNPLSTPLPISSPKPTQAQYKDIDPLQSTSAVSQATIPSLPQTTLRLLIRETKPRLPCPLATIPPLPQTTLQLSIRQMKLLILCLQATIPPLTQTRHLLIRKTKPHLLCPQTTSPPLPQSAPQLSI